MKKFFLFTVLAFSSFFAFADIDLIPGEGARPKQFLQIDIGQSPNRGIERKQIFASIEYNFDFTPFSGMAAIQSTQNRIDIVFGAEWAPFVFYCDKGEWRFGGNSAYHFQKDFGYFNEHDFFLESSVHFKSKNNFSFTSRLGYSWRLTFFQDLENFHMLDGDLTLVNEIAKIWKNGIEVFGAVSSYSTFRYPLFFCPQFTIGLAYNFEKPFRIAAQVDLGITEAFASTLHLNYALLKLNARILF